MSVTDMIVAAQFALLLVQVGCFVVYIAKNDESFGLMVYVLLAMIVLLMVAFIGLGGMK